MGQLTATLISITCAICHAAETVPTPPAWVVTGRHAVVATDSLYASQVGCEILQAGGNAVDAAVAVSFALAVVRPYSTGLGGGAFTIVRQNDGSVYVQDARETAPAAAREDMFAMAAARASGVTHPSRYGALAVAVPGLVAGRCELLERFGTIPLDRLVEPAVRLAETGFPVDRHYVESANDALSAYRHNPKLRDQCRYVYRVHLRAGGLPQSGDMLRQPALARLLIEIGAGGADSFYRGEIATAIVEKSRQLGGILTAEDLASYTVRTRTPIRGTYCGLDIITMPSPSSGGIALVEALNILEAAGHAALVKTDPPLALHYQIEAMKHAFADRARWLGDADFSKFPQEQLLSKVYAQHVAAKMGSSTATSNEKYGTPTGPEDAGTSHFCVVDKDGNIVVSSETINTPFGSLVAVDEWGLILNNEMDDFATLGSEPNAFGLVQSSNNKVAPGKRPLSSMTPTIILRNGSPYLALGGSGGPRIISSVLNVFLGVVDHGQSLEEAISSFRPHHQWLPDRVYFDRAPPQSVADALAARGHRLAKKHKTGIVQAVMCSEHGWTAASDPRKGGLPAGY